MNTATRAIWRILEARFGKMEAQALAFGRARLVRKDVQFIDVKHVSELCEQYRERVRGGIASYRHWQKTHAALTDSIALLYSTADGAALHRRICDDVRLWYIAHRDYHAMRRVYLNKCMGPRAMVEWTKAA